MKPKSKAVFFIFMIVGIGIIIYGALISLVRMTFKEGTAIFTQSSLHVSKDSDGNDTSSYWWHYKFFVDNNSYEVISKAHHISTPNKIFDVVLYNSESPETNMLKDEREDLVIMISGLFFILPMLFFFNPYSKKVTNQENSKRSVGWGFIVFTTLAAIIIYIQSLCDFDLMLKENGYALIILIVFYAIGILFLKGKTNNKVSTNNTSIINQNISNDTYIDIDDNPIK